MEKGYADANLLATLANLLIQPKMKSYSSMRLLPNSKVLDVGCGPATDTIPLAKLLEAKGEVIGVDNDIEMISKAEIRVSELALKRNIKHLFAEAYSLPFGNGYFDAVRSERLFQHLINPQEALSEMIRVTKEKGIICVLDTDWGSFSIDSVDVEIERKLARTLAERVVNNGYSGRQLYRHFKNENLTNITIEMFPTYITNYDLLREITLMDRVEQEAINSGIITNAELTNWKRTMMEAQNRDACFGSASLVMVVGQKR